MKKIITKIIIAFTLITNISSFAYADEIDDLMTKTLEKQAQTQQEAQCQNAYGMSCAEYSEWNSMTEKEQKEYAESLLDGLDSVAPPDSDNPLRKFKAPIIPKPKTLPGPGRTIQETDSSAQNTLLTKIVPRYTIGFIGFIAGIALLFTVIGGARLAMSYGDEEAIEKGKKQITYSIIALIIALLSYTIVNIIINISFQ